MKAFLIFGFSFFLNHALCAGGVYVALDQYARAEAALDRGTFSKAEILSEQLIKEHPEFPQAYRVLGMSEVGSGKEIPDAVENLKKYLNLSDKASDNWNGAAVTTLLVALYREHASADLENLSGDLNQKYGVTEGDRLRRVEACLQISGDDKFSDVIREKFLVWAKMWAGCEMAQSHKLWNLNDCGRIEIQNADLNLVKNEEQALLFAVGFFKQEETLNTSAIVKLNKAVAYLRLGDVYKFRFWKKGLPISSRKKRRNQLLVTIKMHSILFERHEKLRMQ